MADNLLLPVSLEQMVGSDDAIFVAAVYVYDADTTDPKNVYSDATLLVAAANPIIADGDGVIPARYVGTGSYKLVIKDTEGYPTEDLSAHWTTFKTIDNLPGALDTSGYSNDRAIPITPVISKTTFYTILTTDRGKVIDADSTGGDISLTLPSAVTAGDNWRITVKNTGSANSVALNTVLSQTIDGEISFELDDQYESVTIVSDGANWLVTETGRRIELVILPRGYIDGCVISNGSDVTNDINVAAGVCRDSTNTVNITVAAMSGKQLDANWAPGAGAGMRNSAIGIANTTYHIYAVAKADGTQDIYAHTSATVATVITALQAESGGADYIYARRIGSILREGAAIATFVQHNDYFTRKTLVNSVSTSNPGNGPVTATLNVPTGVVIIADVILNVINTASGGTVYGLVTALSDTDDTPSITLTQIHGAAASASVASLQVRTDASGQARYHLSYSDANVTVRLGVRGWFDSRGKDAA